jgi:hypothetical protein
MAKNSNPKTIHEMHEALDDGGFEFDKLPTLKDIALLVKSALVITKNAQDLELDTNDPKKLAEAIFTEAADWFLNMYGETLSATDRRLFLELMHQIAMKRKNQWAPAIEEVKNRDTSDDDRLSTRMTCMSVLFMEALENWEEARQYVADKVKPKTGKSKVSKKGGK